MNANSVITININSIIPWWHSGKESACQCRRCKRHGFNCWIGKIPWSRKRQPTTVLLPGKFHGQRSLASYSPWGHKELDVINHTHTHTHSQTKFPLVNIKFITFPKLVFKIIKEKLNYST